MRVRILSQPTGSIDGLALDQFRVGGLYELGDRVACVFLAERWAEVVGGIDTAEDAVVPPPSVGLVLLVDDDPAILRMTETLLTGDGYHVIVAAHGREAIERLRERCPDVIVLDLNMPVMDGWQFCRERQGLPDAAAAAPVLLVTAEDDAALHAKALHAVDIVRKPFDPDELLAAVSAAIKRPGSAPALSD
jgi:CheY-like chemotaxis protein